MGAEIVGVVTLPGPIDPNRSGQCSFDEVAARLGAVLHETRDVNSEETLTPFATLEPELDLRRRLVAARPRPVHRSSRSEGVFGMHPTLLPRHRGRAPIPWAILTGLARTGVTLFEIVDATADSGSIVGPGRRATSPGRDRDDALRAHRRCARRADPRARPAAPRTAPHRGSRRMPPVRAPGPSALRADGIIDWETRAPYLYDWVRAQTRPYPGAFTFLGDEKVIVWGARAVELSRRRRPGRSSSVERKARSSLWRGRSRARGDPDGRGELGVGARLG